MGRRDDRIALAHEFVATDVVSERGAEAVERVKVFDRNVGLDGVPDGYRAMDARESIKVMVTP